MERFLSIHHEAIAGALSTFETRFQRLLVGFVVNRGIPVCRRKRGNPAFFRTIAQKLPKNCPALNDISVRLRYPLG